MYDHENATKRARTYEEYRKCLIEAVSDMAAGAPIEGISLRTRTGFTPTRILKSFANYVTRIVAREGATRSRLISHPDSVVDSTIHPLLLASVNPSLPIRTRKWRNCAFVILFDVRSTRLVERS